MPNVTFSEETFRRLSERADALGISVDELVGPALERVAGADMSSAGPRPLAGDVRLDDSRKTLHRDRKDARP
jgi:hypothetical protein